MGGAETGARDGRRGGRASIPAGVVALGWVSLLMDTSSETIHSLLPVFLVSALGASALQVGLIEGVAEATASLARLASGVWSDRLRRRKLPTALGYGLSAATKPLFALAPGVGTVLVARFLDRVGKGVRGAPRDALVADLTPPEALGASYGFRQALDTVGALLGPALGIALMATTGDRFRIVFAAATLPAVAAVVVLLAAVREPTHRAPAARNPAAAESEATAAPGLGRGLGIIVAVAALLALARISEAFLVLRGEDLGLSETWAPAVFIVLNAAYAAASYPAGRLSDRIGRRRLLELGAGVLAAGGCVLALAHGLAVAACGVVLWGLHLAATQGVLSALVADVAPRARRATAFGVFHLAVAVSSLASGLVAGALWEHVGPGAAFALSAGCALAALVACAWLPRSGRAPAGPVPT